MKKSNGDGLAVLFLLGLVAVAYWFSRGPVGIASLGPVTPIGDTGNTTPPVDEGLLALCDLQPRDSFSPSCRGVTWDYVNGVPTDFRA